MTQTATVRRIVDNGTAEIAVLRTSACGHDCADCGSCKGDALRQVVALAENTAGAAVGDAVTVESATTHVLGIAAAVYLLPFALFFLLYFLAGGLGVTGGMAIGFGVAGFLIGGALMVLLNNTMKKKNRVAFCIVSVKRD